MTYGLAEREQFSSLRAKGYSIRACAGIVGIAKSTAQSWNEQLENEIASERESRVQAIRKRYAITRESLLEREAKSLQRIDELIELAQERYEQELVRGADGLSLSRAQKDLERLLNLEQRATANAYKMNSSIDSFNFEDSRESAKNQAFYVQILQLLANTQNTLLESAREPQAIQNQYERG